jgi:hypothetical protein
MCDANGIEKLGGDDCRVVLIFSRGEHDDYEVCYIGFSDLHMAQTYLETFEPDSVNLVGLFEIKQIKLKEVEIVKRLVINTM